MKKFETPTMEVEKFEAENILSTSMEDNELERD